jgi:SAM-dependent methyltransferase
MARLIKRLNVRKLLKKILPIHAIKSVKKGFKYINVFNPLSKASEMMGLYSMLYEIMHDQEHVPNALYLQTKRAFGKQWGQLPNGEYMLSDPWFRENVDKIICEEELQISSDWLRGKNVLDAGCGGGRWSYGFAKLGANVTCVDINEEALSRTSEALSEFNVKKSFICSPLETLGDVLPACDYDLVWSWGVLHHCQSFNKSLKAVTDRLKPGGIFYTYLYGRESIDYQDDIELFKNRVKYNFMIPDEEKYNYLLRKVGGDPNAVHQLHDQLAPLMNRRLSELEVFNKLKALGFSRVDRVIQSPELFIRAIKGDASSLEEILLAPKDPPYWFQHHA